MLTQSCPTLWDSIDCSLPGLSVYRDSPGKNTGVGCHILLQGIFPTQGSNPGVPHCRWILYHLRHQGSPGILEWVAHPFSRQLPNPGIEQGSPALQLYSLPAELCRKPIQRKRIPQAWITATCSRHAWAKQLELDLKNQCAIWGTVTTVYLEFNLSLS